MHRDMLSAGSAWLPAPEADLLAPPHPASPSIGSVSTASAAMATRHGLLTTVWPTAQV